MPNIVKEIDEKLNVYGVEVNNMPRKLFLMEEDMAVIMWIVGSEKEYLRKILIQREYDE